MPEPQESAAALVEAMHSLEEVLLNVLARPGTFSRSEELEALNRVALGLNWLAGQMTDAVDRAIKAGREHTNPCECHALDQAIGQLNTLRVAAAQAEAAAAKPIDAGLPPAAHAVTEDVVLEIEDETEGM